jgi:ubiquinone/menaquinone biosynthesis C-methylase UbiE
MTNPWQIMTQQDGQAMDDRKEKGPVRFQVALKRELIWRSIRPHLPKDRSVAVLDLGGGTGVWAIRLAQEGHRVLLTDISPGLLTRAREKIAAADLAHLVQIEEADICDLSRYAEAAFPLVLALGDPLSYCDDSAKALREVRRVTASGGVLVGEVENRYRTALSRRRAATWADAKRIIGQGIAHWPEPENPAAIREFSPSELEALLKKSGWQPEHLYPSDLLASLVAEPILQEALRSPEHFVQASALEECLRAEAALLGSGMEIQFVAVKP